MNNNNQRYEKLLELTELLVTISADNDWERFATIDNQRKAIMTAINHNNDNQALPDHIDPSIVKKILELNDSLVKKASHHYQEHKDELVKLQKSKKANKFYTL